MLIVCTSRPGVRSPTRCALRASVYTSTLCGRTIAICTHCLKNFHKLNHKKRSHSQKLPCRPCLEDGVRRYLPGHLVGVSIASRRSPVARKTGRTQNATGTLCDTSISISHVQESLRSAHSMDFQQHREEQSSTPTDMDFLEFLTAKPLLKHRLQSRPGPPPDRSALRTSGTKQAMTSESVYTILAAS